MTMWQLRRASADDAAAAAMIASASFLEAFVGILGGADIVAHCAKNSSPAKFAGWLTDLDSIVTLAEHPHGAAPIGYTLLTAPDLPTDTSPADIELRRIYTLSLAKSSGLGAALMARAIEDARAMGRTRLLLGVLGTNRRARDFYERHGFAVLGSRQYQVGTALHDDAIYARAI